MLKMLHDDYCRWQIMITLTSPYKFQSAAVFYAPHWAFTYGTTLY